MGRTTVRHELHAKPHGAARAEVYTTHTVVLQPAPGDAPEVRPTIDPSGGTGPIGPVPPDRTAPVPA